MKFYKQAVITRCFLLCSVLFLVYPQAAAVTVKLWDLKSGQALKNFVGHSGIVTSVAFSPDGKYALSGSIDHTLKLWVLESNDSKLQDR